MNVGKLVGLFSIGAASAIFVDLVKNVYIQQKPYPIHRAVGVISALSVLGILSYALSKGGEAETEEGQEYSGIVVDERLAKETCYCEPIIQVRCFARGVIGALSKEQVMKFCPQKYREWLKKLEEIYGETKEEVSLNMPKKEVARR